MCQLNYNFIKKKKYGQNFLINEEILDKIIKAYDSVTFETRHQKRLDKSCEILTEYMEQIREKTF